MAKKQSLTVMADYDCAIWDTDEMAVDLDEGEINVPPEYVQRIKAWIAKYDMENTPDLENFNKEGRALAVELKKLVGSSYKIFFIGEGLEKEEI